MTTTNREAWLTKAIKPVSKLILKEAELVVPETVQASVSFPGGKSFHKVVGQCWAQAAGNGTTQVFVSPLITDPGEVLAILTHELIHAADDNKSKHAGAFRRAWRSVGFEGKPTASTPGKKLAAGLADIAARLGEYPHKGISPGLGTVNKQTTRMLKVECQNEACGAIARMTRKWLDDVGAPTCACGTEMLEIV